MAVTNTKRVAKRGEVHSTNDTELYLFEESDFGELPAKAADRVAHAMRVTAYGDIATELSTISPDYITMKRTQGKALPEMEDAKGGFTVNVTDDSFPRLARSFLYSDDETSATQVTPVGARPDTATIFRRKPTPITTTGANKNITAAKIYFANTPVGLGTPVFATGNIVKVFDYNKGVNNLKTAVLTAADGMSITGGAASFVVQATGLDGVRVVAIGHQFAAGDVTMTLENGKPVLTATTGDFLALGFRRGEQIAVGGDGTALRFVKKVNGFAQVERVEEHKLYLYNSTFTPEADTGATKTLQIYFGSYLTNGSTKRTWTLEQALGDGQIYPVTDPKTYGPMSQLITGLSPNELTLNYEARSFITAELDLMGLFGDVIHAANPSALCKDEAGVKVVPFYGWSGYSTQAGIYRVKLSVLPEALAVSGITNTVPYNDLFGFVDKVTLSINNNVTGRSALGITSYISQNARAFHLSGSLTALFRDTYAIRAILSNFTCNLNIISVAKDSRHCIVYDIPTLTVSGKIVAEKDEDIVLDLEIKGHDEGHVIGITTFTHVPAFLDTI